ncbi:MAG TPA: pitrilysin family protein [Patescibacteria group bacterium]|nr:pitrilysin family protein [Patescibacteria group bacterium]
MNKYNHSNLSNKSNLFVIPDSGAKTATALFIFRTGSRYENKQNNGISHFLEHMFFKGSKKYPNTLSLSSALDALGCEFNAFTSKEYTGYYIKAAASKLGKALDILGDMMLNPKLDAKEIKREKGVIIEELNMYRENPMMHIDDVLENCLYGNTPAGWDIVGTKDNINNFKRADFISYYANQYGGESANLILAGEINKQFVVRAEKILQKLNKGNFKQQVGVVENQKKPQIRALYKNIDQTVLSLAVRTFPINHKEEITAKMLALILGGSMSSRLFINLRERKGLAYFIKTNTEFYSDTGYLSTQAGVPFERTKEAVSIILNEYRRLKTSLVGKEELQKIKDIMEGHIMMQMEASDNLANWYGRQAIMRSKVMTPSDFLKMVNKITSQDLQKTARRIFVSSGLNLALIGRVKNKDFIEMLKI